MLPKFILLKLNLKSKIEVFIQKNNINLDKDIIPDKYLCPISRELMFEPVITEMGINYDNKYIYEWFKNSDKDPYTNTQIESKVLYPNVEKTNDILDFLKSIADLKN